MNSQKEVSCEGESCAIPSEKLYSSQPNVNSINVNAEPTPGIINFTSVPPIPPRNYGNVSRLPMSSNQFYSGAMNRLPFPSSRYPYNNYSPYGYNQTYPYYSYNNGLPGSYGMNAHNINDPESRFIRAAGESVRPTFQAIETVTRAINSIGFMMESTFGSLNMSFQAILSVIETFSQARKFLKHFLASIFTLRIFHKFLIMLLNLMRRMNIISEQVVTRLSLTKNFSESSQPGISMWPLLTFFGLIFGAPYIISRMLPYNEDLKSQTDWDPATDRFVSLVGVHEFKASNDQELSFLKGQQLKMIPPEVMPPSSPYWVFVADDQNNKGFVPRNHVAPV